jgi:hypothetical protein
VTPGLVEGGAVGGGWPDGDVVELVEAVDDETGWVVGPVDVDDVGEVLAVVEGDVDEGDVVVDTLVTGLVIPGSGVPAISPAPVADALVDNGTPGAGGSFGIGGMLNSSRAARAILANVGAEAAAP